MTYLSFSQQGDMNFPLKALMVIHSIWQSNNQTTIKGDERKAVSGMWVINGRRERHGGSRAALLCYHVFVDGREDVSLLISRHVARCVAVDAELSAWRPRWGN